MGDVVNTEIHGISGSHTVLLAHHWMKFNTFNVPSILLFIPK